VQVDTVNAEVWVLVALWFLLASAAWSGIVYVVPWCKLSQLRYSLWRLRDDIVDDLVDGRLSEHQCVHETVQDIERSLRYSQDFTLLNVFIARWCSQNDRLPRLVGTHLSELAPEERDRLKSYRKQLFEVEAHYLLYGSLIGRLLVLLILPVVMAKTRKSTRGGSLRPPRAIIERRTVREMRDRQVVMTTGRPSDKPLSACL
jgi:hypothetical protein